MSELVPLGGLWKKKSRKGTVYYSGRLNNGARLILFKNESKGKDTEPDLRLYIRAVETSADGQGAERFADSVARELMGGADND